LGASEKYENLTKKKIDKYRFYERKDVIAGDNNTTVFGPDLLGNDTLYRFDTRGF
jgi:hypothetical protein